MYTDVTRTIDAWRITVLVMPFLRDVCWIAITECMMTSSNGNIFRVAGPLWGEFTGHWWIPRTKASDAEFWCVFYLRLNKRLSNKQSGGWCFDMAAQRLTWSSATRKRHSMGDTLTTLASTSMISTPRSIKVFRMRTGSAEVFMTLLTRSV